MESVLLVFLALIPPLFSGDTRAMCMMSALPAARDTASTYFVATALPDTVAATAGTGPATALDILSLSTPPGLEPPPDPKQVVFGQEVRLQIVGGSHAEILQGLVETGHRDALLIPWGYQANCSPVLWQESARWIVEGSKGFFRARLRPPSDWVGGIPTFDVQAAWHQPYPTGAWIRREGGQDNEMAILTPEQLFDLYRALPDYETFSRDPDKALRSFEQWEQANPNLVRRWPAWRIGETVRFLAREVKH